MLRLILNGAFRCSQRQRHILKWASSRPQMLTANPQISLPNTRNFLTQTIIKPASLLNNPVVIQLAQNIISRSVTKFSLKKGKRKTVKAVLKRFYRLDWGGWIRTRAGRHKHLWKKSPALKRRLRQHVFVNATQATLLDKMVTKYWKRPKYYVEDPYEPYHSREEFIYTNRKPI